VKNGRIACVVLATVMGLPFLGPAPGRAQDSASFGVSLWLPTLDTGADDVNGYFGGFSFNTANQEKNSAWHLAFLAGTYEEPYDDTWMDTQVFWAYRFWSIVEAGVGVRWTAIAIPTEEQVDEFSPTYDMVNGLGPALLLHIGDNFGSTPIGWYGSLMYMKDMIYDDSDPVDQDLSHLNLEAGLSYAVQSFVFMLGYRTQEFTETETNTSEGGFMFTVAWGG
jgi:hypothetical protein